jgi:hypothetical protein
MKVYKYRGGSDAIMQRDLTAVAENFFWAPTADQLNDPTEAYVNTRMIEDVLSFPAAKDLRSAYGQLAGMRHKVGIYSLSRTPLDELMWAHYANSHTGFCIEYDLDRLILEARTMWDVVDVAYHEEPQTLVLEDRAIAGRSFRVCTTAGGSPRPAGGAQFERHEQAREGERGDDCHSLIPAPLPIPHSASHSLPQLWPARVLCASTT